MARDQAHFKTNSMKAKKDFVHSGQFTSHMLSQQQGNENTKTAKSTVIKVDLRKPVQTARDKMYASSFTLA